MKRALLALLPLLACGCLPIGAAISPLIPRSTEGEEPTGNLHARANVRYWWPTLRGSGQTDKLFGDNYHDPGPTPPRPAPRISYDRYAELDEREGIVVYDAFVGKKMDAGWWYGGRLDYWAGTWNASGATDEDKDFAGTLVPAGTPFDGRMRIWSGSLQGAFGREIGPLDLEGSFGLGYFLGDFVMDVPAGRIANSEVAPLFTSALHAELRPVSSLFVSARWTLTSFAFDSYSFYSEFDIGAGVRVGPAQVEAGYRFGGYSSDYVHIDTAHLRLSGGYFGVGLGF